MLRLYVRDNTNDQVHEYGTNCHDALILQPDGSLHYENMENCTGTKYPEEGYSFCLRDGTIPDWDLEYGMEPYIDIAGEYYREITPPSAALTPPLRGEATAAASGRPTPLSVSCADSSPRGRAFRRLAELLAGLIGLELAVVVLAYRYPLQIGTLRLGAAAALAGSCFVCGMIFERAKEMY